MATVAPTKNNNPEVSRELASAAARCTPRDKPACGTCPAASWCHDQDRCVPEWVGVIVTHDADTLMRLIAKTGSREPEDHFQQLVEEMLKAASAHPEWGIADALRAARFMARRKPHTWRDVAARHTVGVLTDPTDYGFQNAASREEDDPLHLSDAAEIRVAMETLDPRVRLILEQLYIEEDSCVTVARDLDLSQSTVYKLRDRGIHQVLKYLTLEGTGEACQEARAHLASYRDGCLSEAIPGDPAKVRRITAHMKGSPEHNIPGCVGCLHASRRLEAGFTELKSLMEATGALVAIGATGFFPKILGWFKTSFSFGGASSGAGGAGGTTATAGTSAVTASGAAGTTTAASSGLMGSIAATGGVKAAVVVASATALGGGTVTAVVTHAPPRPAKTAKLVPDGAVTPPRPIGSDQGKLRPARVAAQRTIRVDQARKRAEAKAAARARAQAKARAAAKARAEAKSRAEAAAAAARARQARTYTAPTTTYTAPAPSTPRYTPPATRTPSPAPSGVAPDLGLTP